MGSTPKRRRLKALLRQRAVAELGQDATEIDYICFWLEGGGLITELAVSLQDELAEPVSRSFLSMIVHRLSPDATSRITEARRVGATALVEDAITIADNVSDNSSAGVQKAKLRSDIRMWVASRYNRDGFGQVPAPAMTLTLGALHLQAVKALSAQDRLVRLGSPAAADSKPVDLIASASGIYEAEEVTSLDHPSSSE